jgi:hypothetical protein
MNCLSTFPLSMTMKTTLRAALTGVLALAFATNCSAGSDATGDAASDTQLALESEAAQLDEHSAAPADESKPRPITEETEGDFKELPHLGKRISGSGFAAQPAACPIGTACDWPTSDPCGGCRSCGVGCTWSGCGYYRQVGKVDIRGGKCGCVSTRRNCDTVIDGSGPGLGYACAPSTYCL